jgi:hypothetical protein
MIFQEITMGLKVFIAKTGTYLLYINHTRKSTELQKVEYTR